MSMGSMPGNQVSWACASFTLVSVEFAIFDYSVDLRTRPLDFDVRFRE